MIKLSTKFEISNSTHYEDTKGGTKISKIEWFVVEVTQGHWK